MSLSISEPTHASLLFIYELERVGRIMIGKRNGKEKSELVKKEVESRGYTLLNEYINEKTILSLICPNGHSRECTYSSLKNYNCKSCINAEKLNSLISKVESLGYEFIDYPKDARSVAMAYCKNGHIRKAKIHNFASFDCPECVGKNVQKNIEICKEEFSKRGFQLLEEVYVNCKTPMKYICSCGENREATFDAIVSNNTDSCNKCKGKKVSGELSPTWKGGVTPENIIQRGRVEYRDWRKSVFERDEYTCQCCKTIGGNLRGHHILNFSDNEDLRFNVDNGITLCNKCHDFGQENSFHSIYGGKNNTKEQLEEFLGRKL